MSAMAERGEPWTESHEGGFARAGVVECCADGEVEVRVGESGWLQRARVPEAMALSAGDEVLIVGNGDGACWVTTQLSARRRHLELAGGARAEVDSDDPGRLSIYAASGELVLEFDAERGRAVVQAEHGDVEVAAADGDLQLRAANTLRLEGERIEARSRHETRLECGDATSRSGITLSARGARLVGPLVETVAERAEVRARELRQTVGELVTHAETVRQVARKVESVAEQVVEKAKRSLRTVEGLAQLRAGRMRTLVEETWHLKSRKALLRSQRDFKVKADQIHLG